MNVLVGLLSVVVIAAAACSSGSDAEVQVRPAEVPVDLVPPNLAASGLTIHRNTDKQTREVFAGVGERTLVADAKLWELRRGEQLVGALQITTVLPKVDLAVRSQRQSVMRQILPTQVSSVVVEGLPVFGTSSDDKVVYLWFGRGLYEVLQLKGTRLEPERVLEELLRFQTSLKSWQGLPPEAYEEDET